MSVMFISKQDTDSGIVGEDFSAVLGNSFFDRYRDSHEIVVSTVHASFPVGILPKGEGIALQGELIGNFVVLP